MSSISSEVITALTKQFTSRYAKQIASFNKNVYPAAKNDKGNFDVPIVIVGPGGGTLVTGTAPANELKPPARVSLQFRNMKPQSITYRVALPYEECLIASNTPAYFNYLFDDVIAKALGNYKATVGDPDKVRFGTSYVNYTDDSGTVFRQLEDGSLELRFSGEWSSNEEAYD